MKAFIYSNQSYMYVIGVVLVLIVFYFIFKSLPIKSKKKDKKEPEKKADEKAKDDSVQQVEKIDESISAEEKTQEETKKEKKEDKKPKIVQVFKRERKDESGKSVPRALDPIYDRNVEFVNTSKNIAKFKSFADDVKVEEEQTLESCDDFGFVKDSQEDCGFCEDKVKHFDHSRRLSKAIKDNNFDNMFNKHLSEKYLNINMERHLNLNEKFSSKLFERTEQMMSNYKNRVQMTDDENLSEQKYSLFSDMSVSEEDFVDEDEVKINMKTALIADTYFGKRKKLK